MIVFQLRVLYYRIKMKYILIKMINYVNKLNYFWKKLSKIGLHYKLKGNLIFQH
jgi:hypothetical protein